LAFRFVSIVDIFVATLVVPYNKLLDAAILGAVIVVPVRPVIFPKSNVRVIILLVEVNVFCFPPTCASNEVKPLPIFTPFIMILLEVLEPLAKVLPAIYNASVAAVVAPILTPLVLMLCEVFFFIYF
jgi:hypothetical protein